LRVLNLSGNPFTGLPYELGNLQKLQTLDLRNTNYASQDLERIETALPDRTQILK
jgi:Leucine-rich repeat (LRR) protein